jgi:serine/threonine-protein kinase
MDDERLIEQRLTELELARTDVALSVQARIDGRTIARSRDTQPATSIEVTLDLPHISIDGREPAAPGTMPPRSGRADLTLVATLGEGGMGRVHLARQRSLDRDVALKTLKPGAPAASAGALLREARLTGALEHPGVIPVHALGVDDLGRPMLVMKRVDGVDLGTLLADRSHAVWRTRRGDAEPLVASLEVLSQVCLTLEFSHSRGIIHRDIKPENIMVGAFGEVYLLDWGIAVEKSKPDGVRDLVGTPVYMAPEMVRGTPVDERTDVYLLGATLHEILTGRPRHDGRTIGEVMRAAVASQPFVYGPEIPGELADLANRATARDPEARPQSARAFREAIADYLRHRSARALCDVALARLALLEEALSCAPDEAPPADLATAYRLGTEARFGLVQSLKQDPDDPQARAGMQRCLALSIDLELRQRHVETAEALLREMMDPPPHLSKRIAEVRERIERVARERRRLAKLARDLDPSEQATMRAFAAIAMTGVVALSGFALMSQDEPTPGRSLLSATVTLVIFTVGLFLARRKLLTNVFNRRLVSVIGVACAASVTNRIVGLLEGRPVGASLAIELLVQCVLHCALAITLLPRLWPGAVVTAVGVGVIHLLPRHAFAVFGVTTILGIVLAAIILARTPRPRASEAVDSRRA